LGFVTEKVLEFVKQKEELDLLKEKVKLGFVKKKLMEFVKVLEELDFVKVKVLVFVKQKE